MNKVKSVIVVGGGSAGWMAAGYLSVKGFDVTLIESPEVGIVGVGESTQPSINWLANEMGMKEEEWMPLANATYKLGIKHEDWSAKDSTWWHWFLYDRKRHHEPDEWVKNNTIPPLESLEYGYHVDAHEFGETICKVAATKHGCKHVIAHIESVIGNPDVGIQRLITTSGQQFSADFYIDATGWKKLLANVVGMRYEPCKYHLNDRAVASPQPSLSKLNLYTSTKARPGGWIWEIPLTHRRGCGYVYSSQYTTDQEALDEFCKEYPDTDRDQVNYFKFTPEVCLDSIKNNVATVGLSGAFVEPLEATGLWLSFFMVRQAFLAISGERQARVLNKNLKKVFDHIALFVLCHYTLSGRKDNDYWRYFNDLETKIDTRGQVIEKSNNPDSIVWQETTFFFPYNWWSMGKNFNILE
jgi:hypothetical protein